MSAPESFVASRLALVRRRWRTGLMVSGLILVSAVAMLVLTRPVYRSAASLRLGEPPPQGGVSPTAGVLSFFQLGGDPFANDLELLASRTLAESVVDRVALNARVGAPAGWHRDSLLVSLSADRGTRTAVFSARHEGGRVVVRMESPTDSAVATVAPGEPASFGGITAAFLPHRSGMPEEFELSTVPFAEAVRQTRSALTVERPRREANVVAISYDHTDPAVADAVVAATVEAFMALRTSLQQRESGETVDSLRAVAAQTADELRRAEDSLERLQAAARLVAPEAQSAVLVERHAEILSRLAQATGELAAVDEMLRRLEAAGDSEQAWTSLLSYPAFLESETLGNLLSELTALHVERAELATRRSAGAQQVRAVDRQIEYLDGSLRKLAAEYRTGLVGQIASLRPQAAQLEGVLSSLPAQTTELGRRMRDVRVLTEVVVLTEQRLRQEELRDALTYANVQVIDPPALHYRPVWPRRRLGLAVALLLAGALGALAMVVRDRAMAPAVPRSAPVEERIEEEEEEARPVWA